MYRLWIPRSTLYATLLFLLAGGAGMHAFGQNTAHTAAPEHETHHEQIEIPQSVSRRLHTQFPKPPHESVLVFYQNHGANFLIELDSRCIESPQRAADYFAELRARWERLQKAKRRNDKDYNYLLSVLHGQNKSIGMARKIRHIRKTIEERGRRGQLGERLLYLEKKLMEQLADIFVAVQQYHLIELRRMQSELLEMRRLIRQRDINRENIIQSQFKELVGQ